MFETQTCRQTYAAIKKSRCNHSPICLGVTLGRGSASFGIMFIMSNPKAQENNGTTPLFLFECCVKRLLLPLNSALKAAEDSLFRHIMLKVEVTG